MEKPKENSILKMSIMSGEWKKLLKSQSPPNWNSFELPSQNSVSVQQTVDDLNTSLLLLASSTDNFKSLPVLQVLPIHSGGHEQRNVSPSSQHVPPLLQVFASHWYSPTDSNKAVLIPLVLLNVRKRYVLITKLKRLHI